MANQHGDFIWYELLTNDADAAARFYGAVIGWQNRAAEGSDRGYRIFGINGTDVGGLMPFPAGAENSGMRPIWLGYVAVENVDAAAADIVRDGGTQHMPPTDIPGVGRFAMLTDPQGVMFYIMRGAVDATSTAFDQSRFGHCNWNELATSDPQAALAFYRSRFGWEKGDAMPMGEMGDYQFIDHGGRTIGAVMRCMPEGPPPRWTFYFGVEDIDAAAQAVSGNGGAIHYGPAEVPGGVFIIVAGDPQGALFGLVGPRKS
jgi:predicted enzyme related to lactoylglutathione lyase